MALNKIIFALLFSFAIAACSTLPSNYVALTAHGPQRLSLTQMLTGLNGKRVIFIGEAHTDQDDHSVQLEVIKYLVSRGKRPVIALEMFPDGDQLYLNLWVQGRMSESEFAGFYGQHWNISYSRYASIFEYARKRKAPLVGVNAGKDFILAVEQNGLSMLSSGALKRINFTPCAADPEYTAMLRGGFGAHDSGFSQFCNAQRLKDYIMAWHIAQLASKRGGPVVVLLGAAHATKRAVPSLMAGDFRPNSAPPYIVMLPREIKYLLGKEPDHSVADYIWY